MLDTINNNPCYICGSLETYLYKEINGFNIHRCRKCKLLWGNKITQNEIDSFYGKKYFRNKTIIGYKDYLADENNHRTNAKRMIKAANKFIDIDEARILDVGCAFGFLLDEASKKGCDCYGVELSKYAFGYATNTLGLKVFNGEVTNCDFENDFFDIIFLLDTIEHFINPKDVLTKIRKLLKPNGLLILSTINTKGIFRLYSLKPPEHIFYFNHLNLTILLKNLGYEILSIKNNFLRYKLYDLFYRIGKFSSVSLFSLIAKKLEKNLSVFSINIPTNSMLVIAKKS